MPAVLSRAGAASGELIHLKNFLMGQLTNPTKPIPFPRWASQGGFCSLLDAVCRKWLVLLILLAGQKGRKVFMSPVMP